MPSPIRPPISRLPAPSMPKAGQVTTSRSVTQTAQGGDKRVVHQQESVERLVFQDGPATVGLGTGVTIPGPKGSYAAGRVEVYVYLPAPNSAEGTRTALDTAERIIEERLESGIKEIQEYLQGYAR